MLAIVKGRRKVLSLIGFSVLFGILFLYVSLVLEAGGSKWSNGKYYAGNSDCDIIAVGTSHVLYGIYPQVMAENGVTGVYNLGGHSQRIPTSYWVIKNAIDNGEPRPKLVILDLYGILMDGKYDSEHMSFIHTAIDSMPLSRTKMEMLDDLVPDDKFEFICKLYKYHSRWSEVALKDLEVLRYYLTGYHGLENGASYDDTIKSEGEPVYISEELVEAPNGLGREYFDRIVTLCKEEGIKLLVVNIPYNQGEMEQKTVNWVRQYANEKQFFFYDLFRDDGLAIDYDADFCGGSHLNRTGAVKVSRKLSGFILDNNLRDF